VMVVGDPNYKRQGTRVPAQLEAARSHYGDMVLITFQGPGPSYTASAWAVQNGVYFAELPNLRGRHGDQHPALAAQAALSLRPAVCLAFGTCPAADAARWAGVPTYEV